MALDTTVKELLNKFADTQPALRLSDLPLSQSNPMIGDAIDAALELAAGSSSAADAAQSASDAADSADAAAASAASAADAAYTPATAGDWDGSPATLKAAVDRLAAAVEGLLSNPIP